MTERRPDDGRRRRTRARLALVAVFALFFVPVLIAYWLNLSHPHWLPFGTRNVGELVRPPVALDAAGLRPAGGGGAVALQGHWTLLMTRDGACDAACEGLLHQTRQARFALGKDMGRVQRLLVSHRAGGPALLPGLVAAHPDLHRARADADWLAALPGGGPALYLVDPQGYLILRYPLPADGSGLLKDLKRLLRISKIG